MDVWTWVNHYREEARRAGDAERVRMTLIQREAYAYREMEPPRMMAMLQEGRALAQRLREPWWVLFFEFWRTEAIIHYLGDFTPLLDQAVATALEARKPLYDQHPLRFAIYGHLTAAYLYIDPRGYQQEIETALADLEKMLPDIVEERYIFLGRRCTLAEELGRLDEAVAINDRSLALLDGYPNPLHHQIGYHATACRLHQRRGDWTALAACATTGEALARRKPAKRALAKFLLWRALWSRHEGDEEQARRLWRSATAQMARLGAPPGESYYDALCAYHELGGNLAGALKVRNRHLAELQGKGMLSTECDAHIKRCRLLATMGRLGAADLAAARAAAMRLRAPAHYLEQIENVVRW